MKEKLKIIITPDSVFLIVLVIILLGGLIKPIIMPKNVNYYENRSANKLPKVELHAFLKGDFQDDIELAYADQIPLSTYMKKGYNFINNKLKLGINFLYYSKFDNIYVPLSGGVSMFGDSNNLVYLSKSYMTNIDNFNKRIENINNIIKNNNNIDFYIYFIETDTEIDFTTNANMGTYDYLKTNLNIKNNQITHLSVNDFNDYREMFYKTDHHWNYNGSYQGYKDVINMIYKDDVVLEPVDMICFKDKFSGTKAACSGTTKILYDNFCTYKFDISSHHSYINGIEEEYGKYNDYFNDTAIIPVNYGEFYGWDNKIIKFDFNNPKKENLLILGNSYDNAINVLLASHFNVTYNVDLRRFDDDNEEFVFQKFVKENKIDKVLMIGNYDFFEMQVFNLER